MNFVNIAVLICTYKREDYIKKNIRKLANSKFFVEDDKYLNHMDIFVSDNANELVFDDLTNGKNQIHLICNRENAGGSGGFQKALEEARKCEKEFSHIVFMDDDVEFDIESFYILYDYLENASSENFNRPVAGRMFCIDKPTIQYTAAEIWDGGSIQHVEFMRDTSEFPTQAGKVVVDSEAEYGGWWFCCYPMSFAKDNDIIPFFIHCDDVEYGLRYGKKPVIIEGVQVWHETYEKRMTPLMLYYDTRNPLFVNQIYQIGPSREEILLNWKEKITSYHVKEDWLSEYYVIKALDDYLKGMDWLYKINSAKYHKRLQRAKSCRIKNAILWRLVERRYRRRML